MMLKRQSFTSTLLTWILLLVPSSYPQGNAKKRVRSRDDLPRFTYPIKGSASDLIDKKRSVDLLKDRAKH